MSDKELNLTFKIYCKQHSSLFADSDWFWLPIRLKVRLFSSLLWRSFIFSISWKFLSPTLLWNKLSPIFPYLYCELSIAKKFYLLIVSNGLVYSQNLYGKNKSLWNWRMWRYVKESVVESVLIGTFWSRSRVGLESVGNEMLSVRNRYLPFSD